MIDGGKLRDTFHGGKLHDGGGHVPRGSIACRTHRSKECHDSERSAGEFCNADNHSMTCWITPGVRGDDIAGDAGGGIAAHRWRWRC